MKYLCFLFLFLFIEIQAQTHEWSSSRIQHEIEKLQVTTSVMYLAAHPDDENTRLLTWLANEAKVRTAYLSLTRGDGGQNLIGTEKGALLGVLRTQELLEARKIDGAEQFFSRAVDFGYSKSADEAFDKWEKEKILEDVVYAIRKFQPDIIVTRFPPSRKAGHGHHEASAIIAEEAIIAAADPSRFPSHLEFVQPWRVHRLMHNSSTFFTKDLEKIASSSNDFISIDVGGFNSLLGESNNTIAMKSRSQHRCQGFGSELERGKHIEYLKYVSGSKPKHNDLFYGIDQTWKNLDPKSELDIGVKFILDNFDHKEPSRSVPVLIALHEFIRNTKSDKRIKHYKLDQVEKIIMACLGLHIEALAKTPKICRGEEVIVDLAVLQRSSLDVELYSIMFNNTDSILEKPLKNNIQRVFPISYSISRNSPYTNPFWLNEPFENVYDVAEIEMRNRPKNLAHHLVYSRIKIKSEEGEIELNVPCPIRYKWVDKADGELYRDLSIVPKVTIESLENNVIFKKGQEKSVSVKVIAHIKNQNGILMPRFKKGWMITPKSKEFQLEEVGDEAVLEFSVIAPQSSDVCEMTFVAKTNEGAYNGQMHEVFYWHIEPQSVLLPAKVKLVNIDIKRQKNVVGYIPGSGDETLKAIAEMGYEVESLLAKDVASSELSKYETIVVGIRAYNIHQEMEIAQEYLLEYVENGGNLIVQYNTNRGLKTEKLGPYPIHLSAERVTDESATVTFLQSGHALLMQPNILNTSDFDGWIQERGLYFANEYDERYTPLFSANDPGEDPKTGSTLVCNYGKGTYIFTGLSFFRQLPAGVPGAYRTFCNFIEFKQ